MDHSTFLILKTFSLLVIWLVISRCTCYDVQVHMHEIESLDDLQELSTKQIKELLAMNR